MRFSESENENSSLEMQHTVASIMPTQPLVSISLPEPSEKIACAAKSQKFNSYLAQIDKLQEKLTDDYRQYMEQLLTIRQERISIEEE